MPIGVFDSGIGGLTVLARLQAALPGQAFIYLGDNANAPYGMRTPAEIFDLTTAGCAALFAQDCNLVILACNTAAAVALRRMQEFWVPADRRTLGVFVPMIEALAQRPWAETGAPRTSPVSRILLFATPATVASHAFPREFALRATGARIAEVPCPGLVEALEAGDRQAAETLAETFVARGLADMPDPQAAILGCTHYPLLRTAFARALPRGTRILSQPDIVAASLGDYLGRHPRFAGAGPSRHLTTGDPEAVRTAARRLLGRDIPFEPLPN